MSPAAPTQDEHDVEVAKQAEIAAEVDAAVDEKPVDPTPPETDQPLTVTLRSKNVEQYPLFVSVVGAPELVFESENDAVDVSPAVAEQVTYLQNVEVAA
jgi:hypothetical protein